ncbi:MAG: Holliday junction resolvase RuvX [Clostridia bacterium]|nr:Holliday junction resolvase RuvX [Clostridia bacterium]MDD4276039.1 Holliday junction resolvase RuvX [Clostridia bacterium]
MYKRKMGLDYGDVRIGIALSDLMGIIANAYETYTRVEIEKDIQHIINIINLKEVDTVVIGLPINMDGTSGIRVEKTKDFAQKLSDHTTAKIVFIDERLTSVSAEKILINAEVRRENRRLYIDQVSASIILQDYLDRISRKSDFKGEY